MDTAVAPAPLSSGQTTAAADLGLRASLAAVVWDRMRQPRMAGGETMRVGAIVENIIAAIQARVEPSEWGAAAAATAEAIERRCSEPSAVAAVLLRIRPGIANACRGFRPDQLGTDAVGRGAGWNKTANTVEIAKACNDVMAQHDIASGAVFRALKDILIAGLQGALSPDERATAGKAIGRLIERRMVV